MKKIRILCNKLIYDTSFGFKTNLFLLIVYLGITIINQNVNPDTNITNNICVAVVSAMWFIVGYVQGISTGKDIARINNEEEETNR